MKKVFFLFGVHCHQPVGNLDAVFKKAFLKAYSPFINILEKFPLIKTTLHFSGCLIEWLETEESAFLEKLRTLSQRGQIEMMGGGFYEPMFCSIPEKDVAGQILMMAERMTQLFQKTPKGCWIPERIWESVLPRILSLTGHSYTLLDSSLFLRTGIPNEKIRGYFVTEKEGHTVSVFPIQQKLRYLIPFQKPEKTIEYLRYVASDIEDVAISYADDGEKFGLWPGTHSLVYEQGWLESFFKLLEKNRDTIKTLTFSEYHDNHKPEGLVYLPPLSYDEMMEWALPAEAWVLYNEFREKIKQLDQEDSYSQFLSAGFWNNFFMKYPESNNMNKKMLLLSRQLESAKKTPETNDILNKAAQALYKGQCGCGYWHGMFGGVYLGYLRSAVYKHLINCENYMDRLSRGSGDWIDYSLQDFHRKQSEDVLISGKNLNAYFSPDYGGTLFELDIKHRCFNLLNTMTRQMEWYHSQLKEAYDETVMPADEQEDDSESAVPADFQGSIAYDWYRRLCFLDHFLGSQTTLENFSFSRYPELGGFVTAPYKLTEIKKTGTEVCFTLACNNFVSDNNKDYSLRIEKNFRIIDPLKEIHAAYKIMNTSEKDLDLWFGVEFNLNYLAENTPEKYFRIPGWKEKLSMSLSGEFYDIESFEACNSAEGFGLRFYVDRMAMLWCFPLKTVSRSEKGFELTYQGSTILLHWKMTVKKAAFQERTFMLKIS